MKRWQWFGDVNPKNGGTWIRPVPEYGDADAVRITPCSDAGGPCNLFWVECVTVLGLDDADRRQSAAKCCGISAADMRDPYTMAEALLSYGFYDPANCYPEAASETVQVGAQLDPYASASWDPVTPTVTLRSNADIGRYARKLARERL